MSGNDRCGEALEILAHGGTIPTTDAVREWLMDRLEAGRDGYGGPTATVARAILNHPDNADLKQHVWDGEWHGPAAEYGLRLPDGHVVRGPGWACEDDVIAASYPHGRRPGGDLVVRDGDGPWRVVRRLVEGGA